MIDVESWARVWQVITYDVSPRGDKIAFTWNRPGKWDAYLKDITTGETSRLTQGSENYMDPVWSPDGSELLYVGDRGGDENFDIFLKNLRNGEVRRLTDDLLDDHSARWSPHGDKIAFISNRGRDNLNLFLIDSSDEIKQLSHGPQPVFSFAWSRDAKTIAYTRGFYNTEVFLASVPDGKTRRILHFPSAEVWVGGPEAWSPDNNSLIYTSNVNDKEDIALYDLRLEESSWLVRSRWEKGQPVWSGDGSKIAYVENVEGNLLIKEKLLSSGDEKTVSPAEGSAYSPKYGPNGDLFFLYSGPTEPPDVWCYNNGSLLRLTHSLENESLRALFVRPTRVRYNSRDGLEIHGMLYRRDTKPGPGPSLVYIHGGPDAQVLNSWNRFIQFLAAQGYTILAPDYRGSTGYGRRFNHLNDRDLGGGDLEDIAAAADFLVANNYASLGCVGVYGASYGGYLTYMGLTKRPEKWAVGVSIVGFVNWKTEFEHEREYLQAYDAEKVGRPEEQSSFYYDRSPINFVKNIMAPILILHGENDPRCPAEEAHQFIDSLQKDRKIFDYKIYQGEGHSLRKIENLLDALRRTLVFFDSHLKLKCR